MNSSEVCQAQYQATLLAVSKRGVSSNVHNLCGIYLRCLRAVFIDIYNVHYIYNVHCVLGLGVLGLAAAHCQAFTQHDLSSIHYPILVAQY